MAYYLINGFWWLFSLLPLRLLYVLSDCVYYLLYYCIRYRRKVVRKNLVNSFPGKSEKEIIHFLTVKSDFSSIASVDVLIYRSR